MKTVVLDAGALIAIERRDQAMVLMARKFVAREFTAHVPTPVIAQVWRGGARQHAVIRLVRSDAVRVEPLTVNDALNVGRLLAVTGTSDVVDGHVAFLARSLKATVITSDPKDLRRLDPGLELITV